MRPADLGVKALDEVVPIQSPDVLRQRQPQDPKAANRIFYYTARFRQAAAVGRDRFGFCDLMRQHVAEKIGPIARPDRI